MDDFADFLQHGATLDDSTLLQAFVSYAIVDDDSMSVTLNYDAKETEPARFSIQQVRTIGDWLPATHR